jgi:cobalt-zinc-cadmium efflux system protein
VRVCEVGAAPAAATRADVSLGHHYHRAARDADGRRLAGALALIVAFMTGEVVVGIFAHSLALLSDAAHMLTDAAAVGLSLVAMRLAARTPKGGLTYGLKRAEILSALTNGLTLCLLGGLIVYEAVRRLISPPPIRGWPMLAVALVGIVVNVAATWQLSRADRRRLNIRGSYQHILTDLYAFVGTAIAAGVILTVGFVRADPIASLVVAGLMLRTAYGLMRDAGRVLLEAAPADINPRQIEHALRAHQAVTDVHDLHVWEITSGFPALSAHVLVRPQDDCHSVRRDLEKRLDEEFGIDHTTLQVDHDEGRRLLSIQSPAEGREGA